METVLLVIHILIAVFLIGVVLLNLKFLHGAWVVLRSTDKGAPMQLFRFSISYIMLLFAVLLVDHYSAAVL